MLREGAVGDALRWHQEVVNLVYGSWGLRKNVEDHEAIGIAEELQHAGSFCEAFAVSQKLRH